MKTFDLYLAALARQRGLSVKVVPGDGRASAFEIEAPEHEVALLRRALFSDPVLGPFVAQVRLLKAEASASRNGSAVA